MALVMLLEFMSFDYDFYISTTNRRGGSVNQPTDGVEGSESN